MYFFLAHWFAIYAHTEMSDTFQHQNQNTWVVMWKSSWIWVGAMWCWTLHQFWRFEFCSMKTTLHKTNQTRKTTFFHWDWGCNPVPINVCESMKYILYYYVHASGLWNMNSWHINLIKVPLSYFRAGPAYSAAEMLRHSLSSSFFCQYVLKWLISLWAPQNLLWNDCLWPISPVLKFKPWN